MKQIPKKEISTQKIKNYIREQLWYKIFWGKISYVNGKTPGKNEKLVFRIPIETHWQNRVVLKTQRPHLNFLFV